MEYRARRKENEKKRFIDDCRGVARNWRRMDGIE